MTLIICYSTDIDKQYANTFISITHCTFLPNLSEQGSHTIQRLRNDTKIMLLPWQQVKSQS